MGRDCRTISCRLAASVWILSDLRLETSHDLRSQIVFTSVEMKQDVENNPMEEEPPMQGTEEVEDEGMHQGEEDELNEDEAAEFSLLNRQLDQLDQALDAIEEKNDDIHSKLKELLEESKQARKEIEAENNEMK